MPEATFGLLLMAVVKFGPMEHTAKLIMLMSVSCVLQGKLQLKKEVAIVHYVTTVRQTEITANKISKNFRLEVMVIL